MRILITNDDGIHAEGIKVLARVAAKFGEVKISAPDRERSACGHAMTMRDPLRIFKHDIPGAIEAIAVNGLPVDCVNVGLTIWNKEFDLILSGINNGPNMGFDVTYSGTAAGAMEGAINKVKSIAFSMALFVDGAPLHYDTAEKWLTENLQMLIDLPYPEGTFYNINIPAIAYEEINGHKFTAMGKRVYEDRVEPREDPWGRQYFWQGGIVVMRTSDPSTDVYATSNGFVSITPVSIDWTNTRLLEELNS